MQCNAMQCNAMQCNAMQCNAMQCNAMQCNAMQCNAMQCNAMQYSTIQWGYLVPPIHETGPGGITICIHWWSWIFDDVRWRTWRHITEKAWLRQLKSDWAKTRQIISVGCVGLPCFMWMYQPAFSSENWAILLTPYVRNMTEHSPAFW